MSSKIHSSPNWKKPSEIMKMHRRKKRSSLPNPLKNSLNHTITKPIFGDITNSEKRVKRRNPFARDDDMETPAPKRQNVEQTDDSESPSPQTKSDCSLLRLLNQQKVTQNQTLDNKKEVKCDADCGDDSEPEQSEEVDSKPAVSENEATRLLIDSKSQKKKSEMICRSQSVPVDWSLKVKMRVVSDSSLTWTSQLKTQEESQGVSNFVRQIDSEEPHAEHSSLSSQKSSFQSSLMYWVYPNLPWFRNFPRITSDNKGSKLPAILMNEEIQNALQADWSESFTSAFHQLRSQQCPYFYLCAHQFTVLFRSPGLNGYPGPNALLTPTTRGLRESLKTEGIEFTLPLLEFRKQVNTGESPLPESKKEPQLDLKDKKSTDVGEDIEEDFLDTDEGASVWLEELGLDKKSFPSLDPHRVKLQRECFRAIDNRPESLVLVEGGEVQAIFNFLLNCRGCTATSGPQAGVPPTILAPRAFKGATLRSSKFKHSSAKQADDKGNIKHSHIVEVGGPILPHHVQSVCQLLRRTQTSFSISFNNHEPSLPFNVSIPGTNDVNNSRSIVCGSADRDSIKTEKFEAFYTAAKISETLAGIRELNCTADGVSWQT
ncbi:hypothetical protein ScPMuIL_012928 [Solemya velum]